MSEGRHALDICGIGDIDRLFWGVDDVLVHYVKAGSLIPFCRCLCALTRVNPTIRTP